MNCGEDASASKTNGDNHTEEETYDNVVDDADVGVEIDVGFGSEPHVQNSGTLVTSYNDTNENAINGHNETSGNNNASQMLNAGQNSPYPKRSFHMTSESLAAAEEQATRDFLEIVNASRAEKNISPLSWSAAVKFLMARKFSVRRALELYQQHHIVRLQEGLVNFDPTSEPLRSELLSGKFTVLPARDLGGAIICLFSARLHQPSATHQESTLQCVVYQLDAALEDPVTQRSGLVFIYDMTDSKYSHFDYDLSIKILSLLKGGYPARLKKVLIVTAPLWFRAPFRILRLFVREKLRDRVFTVSLPQLAAHIPNSVLPKSLGGQLVIDHHLWLAKCNSILDSSDLWGISPEESFRDFGSSRSSSKDDSDMTDNDSLPNGQQNSPMRKSKRNGSDDGRLPYDDKTGLSILNFIEHVKQKGRRGLMDEYAEIVSKNPEGSFNASKQRGNISKNRYSDVLCLDHTRVTLSTTEGNASESTDYINANFVDGFKQRNAFISTQGPLPRTFGDFWRMIWEQKVLVVVMTTRAVERGRTKCGQYWPPDQSTSVCHESFRVENKEVETYPDYILTRLRLCNTKTGDARNVTHLQFLSWPDYGVPSSAKAMLSFLEIVRREQENGVKDLSTKWEGNVLGPPIVVHCSAGIGRTGTLCTIDICVRRLLEQGMVDVLGTVEKIRSQRAHSIQVPEQYLFCHAAVLEFSRAQNIITEEQLIGVPDLLQEGDSDSE